MNADSPKKLVENLDRPLSEIIRPKSLSEYIGQEHLLSKDDGLILNFFRLNYLPSMILSGPPGVGKTTLARLLANDNNYVFVELSATDSTVSDLKELSDAIESENKKRFSRNVDRLRVLVFIDEIHRFTTIQQDYLLPFIECGTFVFVGATTVNPSQRLRKAILSRCQVFELKPLGIAHVKRVITRAVLYENIRRKVGAGLQFLSFSSDAINVISRYANGDMRSAIKFVEAIGSSFRSSEYAISAHPGEIIVDAETATQICSIGQTLGLRSSSKTNDYLLQQLLTTMKSEWESRFESQTGPNTHVTFSKSEVSFEVKIRIPRDSPDSDLESIFNEDDFLLEEIEDPKQRDWSHHMVYSDDSDVEPGDIYSDAESTPEKVPLKFAVSKQRVVSSLHLLLLLLQRDEDPLLIIKSLILFCCKCVPSDNPELPKVVAAMKSIQKAGTDVKRALANVVERLTLKQKLQEELTLQPIKEFLLSRPHEITSDTDTGSDRWDIDFDEEMVADLLYDIPEETIQGNLDVFLTPWEELKSEFTLGE